MFFNGHIKYRLMAARMGWMLFFSTLQQITFCQVSSNNPAIHTGSTIYFDDLLKQQYQQDKYPGIKGSPFYLDDWKYADLVLKDGKHAEKVRVKLNLYSQELICMWANKEITLMDGIIHRMILYDTTEEGRSARHLFASDMRLGGKDSSYPFFEVVTEGKAILLNLIKKKITSTGDALAIGEAKEFAISETLYVFYKSELKKCEKSSDFYTRLFSDQKDRLEDFVKSQNLKCKTRQEAMIIVAYYNSL